MNERKQKIADFIESVKDGGIESNTVLLGGAKQDPDGINTTTNGTCSNGTIESCNKSTNSIDCKNIKGMCNNSKNPAVCVNDATEPRPTNISCNTSGTT